ncbi:MAG: TonB-dependent receptor [Bryobacteraceae bacterium]|nr:TonB-dependent receptor [Bryobacteraceae bacterium]
MFRILFAVACSLAMAGWIEAQTFLGAMTGRVVDPSGGRIPSATVTATNQGTGVAYKTVSNEAGIYVLQQLPVGRYDVSVEAAGFRKLVRRDIELNVAQTLSFDAELEVGQVEQAIEVTADLGQLQTASSDLGTTIQRNKLMELPLFVGGNMRNLEQFIFLAPGVTGDTGNTQISGSPSRAKEVLVDGVASTGIESGGVIPGSGRPSVEAIGEFRMVRANFNAEYGRTGGGVQIFTTRSGGNDFHGSLFNYLRNDQLDARGFFQRTRQINRQNEFGAALGGPVLLPSLYNGRNKTFFHFVYSGYRYRQGSPNTLQSVIPLDFRQGDFSRANPIYDPLTNQSTPTGIVRTQFPNNQIPQSRFSSVSQNILPLLPTPDSNNLFNNFLSIGRGQASSNQVNIKLDHSFSDASRISGYYYRDGHETRDPELVPGPTTPNRRSTSRNNWARISHDLVISPSMLNHVTLGYTRFATGIQSYSLNQDWPNQIGLTGVNTGPDNVFPCVEFIASGFSRIGDQNCNSRVLQTNNAFQVGESLSWIRGSHALKFGFDYRWMETNGIDPWRTMGWFQFNALETALPGVANTGNAIASFLLGNVNRGQLQVFSYFPRNRYQYWAWYAQDDWKVTRKLTLNYGLRHDIFIPRYENRDNLSTFDLNLPNPAAGGRPGAMIFLGEGEGRSGLSRLADVYGKAFGPRLGVAYALNQKTVLRSGYGIYYAQGNANAGLRDSLQSSVGFVAQPVFQSQDAGVTPGFNWDGGFPQNFARPPFINPAAGNGSDVRMMLRSDGRPPYFQNWSFTIEREIVPSVNVEAAYLGTKGTRIGNGLVHWNELNPSYLNLGTLLTRPFDSPEAMAAGIVSPYPGFRGSVAQALRPYPHMQTVWNRSNPAGSSTYHALQTQVSMRSWKGLDVQMAYTWAKTISDADILAGGGPTGQTTYNRGLEKAIATTDVPHVFALSYSYELPFGQGKPMLSGGGVAGRVFGGWIFTGIHQYSSGVPIVLTANNTLPLFTPVLRPNANPNVNRRVGVDDFDPATDLWINRAAFAAPPAFTFGTSARSYTDLRNPSFRNENFGLLKRIRVYERLMLTVRAELFNAFNRVVFSAPQANVSNAQFGRISGQANQPRQGQLALRLDF